ncbi:MAG: hypothetical protein WBE20_06010 [Candidatus Acidiferrales bacterium]
MKSLLETALAKLEKFPDEYQEIQLNDLRLSTKEWLAALAQAEKKSRRGFPQIQLAHDAKNSPRRPCE